MNEIREQIERLCEAQKRCNSVLTHQAPVKPMHVPASNDDDDVFVYQAFQDAKYSLEKLLDRNEKLEAVVSDLNDLMDQSVGVSGLHLNGDVADWDWLKNNGWLEELANLEDQNQ